MRLPWLSSLSLAALLPMVEAASLTVDVGKNGELKFDPETVQAEVGDTITYHFYSGNYSVTQTSLEAPCQPAQGGFFSGFTSWDSNDKEAPVTWTITVNGSSPIWVYSSQSDECQQGMLHAINPSATGNETFDSFKASAQTANAASPGDSRPTGGQRVLRVNVGVDDKLEFSPSTVQDQTPGTVIQFAFNPKNHSVVQSSFDDPCHPLAGGFSSGFIPVSTSPSGVLFDIVLNNTDPIWFYDAQTGGGACQQGMVGSINAPAEGDNFDRYKDKASRASGSTIPSSAPLGGKVTVNGTVISTFDGAILDVTLLDDDTISRIPKVGENDQFVMGMAGGGSIANYNWGSSMSDNTTQLLQLIQFIDNILLETLFDGYERLNGGDWAGVYPKSIVETIGSMAAQSYIHRTLSTDSLQHFEKRVLGRCAYKLPLASVDDFLQTALKLLNLEMGLYIDISSRVAVTEPWLVPVLATSLGAKGRMTAVINMMQNHIAAAAPREVSIPAELVFAYAKNTYVSFCVKDEDMPYKDAIPGLKMAAKESQPGGERVSKVSVFADGDGDKKFVAWLGPYGDVKYTALGQDGIADVPTELYGHVWAVVTKSNDAKLGGLKEIAVAGPEMIWISQP